MADTACIPFMTRPTHPFRGLAALLAAVLLAAAVGPAAAAVADALGEDTRSHCERMGHTTPSGAPDGAPADTSTCCISAPEGPRDAVAPAPPAPLEPVVAAALAVLAPPAVVPAAAPPDAGPPPGPRRHLALSVLLV